MIDLRLLMIGGLAVGSAMVMPLAEVATIEVTPWNPMVVRTLAFGSDELGADLMWMRAVQLIGDRDFDEKYKPQLIDWLEGTAELDPTLRSTYTLGAVVLVGRSEDSARLDRILAKGEAKNPNDYQYALLRGFVAYFGDQENAIAAKHLRRAATFPGAPGYLASLATRLESQATNCRDLASQMQAMRAADATLGTFKSSTYDVVINCVRNDIRRAASKWRNDPPVTVGDELSVELLYDHGYLRDMPPIVPGKCWRPVEGGSYFDLVWCPENRPR